ncbi:hypothetical protein B0H65DRAFT_510197 [Neurospora tetraspora]|uniref:DUF1996 domain-containing protein n=1 Tax=Neurospora tetraspora TaxID=94610 RepID=A0AAE0MRR1_9PEZI|nr:hypothetical protein B0H65DRAFT_510197 [Neurospora tetraspora]
MLWHPLTLAAAGIAAAAPTMLRFGCSQIIPQSMLGIVWDTTQFNNKAADWPAADGSQQPFVLSTGDPTGYGQHGDYVFGWKGDSLQKLMDDNKNCIGSACGGLKAQDAGKANACRVSGKGWLEKLPGMEMPM